MAVLAVLVLLLLLLLFLLIIFQKGTRGEKLGTHTRRQGARYFAAACKLFQSQLSWGFLINECLSEFSILFDFARMALRKASTY